MYGLPLKIDPPMRTKQENDRLHVLKEKERDVTERLNKGKKVGVEGGLRNEREEIQSEIKRLKRSDCLASLDSEISLVFENNYGLDGWIPNPYFWGFKEKEGLIGRENVLMVSRLDGPSEKIVKRMIDDTLQAEKGVSKVPLILMPGGRTMTFRRIPRTPFMTGRSIWQPAGSRPP